MARYREAYSVISQAGELIHESTELLGSTRMKDLVQDMKTVIRTDMSLMYRPLPSSADALARPVYYIMMECGETSTNYVKEALELIPQDKVINLLLSERAGSVYIRRTRTSVPL